MKAMESIQEVSLSKWNATKAEQQMQHDYSMLQEHAIVLAGN